MCPHQDLAQRLLLSSRPITGERQSLLREDQGVHFTARQEAPGNSIPGFFAVPLHTEACCQPLKGTTETASETTPW